jgi:BirA family biotin operon repressor/biotin-[acetyl-CoA-carboxylase] ligase
VAVWKGVRSLITAGYPIESGETGYWLAEGRDTDFLYPWEFGEHESRFRYFSSTNSTMDRAREYAQGLEASSLVIAAETQTAGRGRSGRNWASDPGGLFFTLLERPNLAVADYLRFAMEIQIATARTVTRLCGKQALLRWPNDVYAGDKKIAGVLTELSGEGDRLRWISSGVGINVNNSPRGAASCSGVAGHPLSRCEGLRIFLDELEKLRKSGEARPSEIQGLWNSLARGIGSPVAVIPAGHGNKKDRTAILREGIFLGVDPQGRCLIQDKTRGAKDAGGKTAYFPGMVSLKY